MTRRHTPERLTLDAILPRLRTKRISKRNGERHVLACCPAHDDTNPSLSLTEKADGTLLWKCFAGCSQEAVREALERLAGVRPATARPIAPRRNRQQQGAEQYDPVSIDELAAAKRLTAEKLRAWHAHDIPAGHAPEAPYGGIAIPYRNANGDLHTIQYRRTLEKVNGVARFKWRTGDTRILYGLWRVPEWGNADTLYLCEGTSDTWTLWHADLPALGIPSATYWREEWWREVEGFERIVLIPDNDEAGEKLAREIAKTCPDHLRERVQVLQLPEGVKDANELWQREGANAERFRNALAECAVQPLMQLCSYAPLNTLHNCITSPIDLAEATPRPVEWLVKDLIPARHATNLYGDSGTGKSLIALYLALCVIEGIPFLNFPTTKRGKVLYLDLELDAEIHTLRWWAIARGAGYTTPPKGLRYVRWTQGLIGREGELWELIEQEQPALLIVDSFGKATGKPLDPDLAIALYNLFDALPVPVLVIDHTAKPNPEIPAESAREYGTVYKRHYARSAIQVDLQGSERGHIGVILRHQKSNFGRLAPEIPLTLAFLEEDGVMLEVRLQYGGQAVQANAELFGRRGEVVRFLSENGEATQKQIAENLDTSQSSVSRLLKQLAAEGLIEEIPDTYPKRYRLLGSYAVMQPLNSVHNCISGNGEPEPNSDPDGGSYAVMQPLNSVHNCISADADLSPDLFQNRTPLESCIPADLLQAWLPQGIADADLDAVQVMLAFAEARGFPSLEVDLRAG
jgi:DNA-binding transcriptional ArsR family regulator